MSRPRILVITPVRHIEGVAELLEGIGEVTYLDDPTPDDVRKAIGRCEAVFTNPNRSNVFLGRELFDAAPRLKAICTASTGTTHIDLVEASARGIAVLSLTEERTVIDRISSTAELALGLMLASLRRIPEAASSVRRGQWDYTAFIGRQLDHLTIGVVGYGRLGSRFAKYCQALGSRIVVYEPHHPVRDVGIRQVELEQLLTESDVMSLHAHATDETRGMVDRSWFARMKPSVLLVNTARGELIHEADLIDFLHAHPQARFAGDVIADETQGKSRNPLVALAKAEDRVLITTHIGGMTVEGQRIAYQHAARRLKECFEDALAGTGRP